MVARSEEARTLRFGPRHRKAHSGGRPLHHVENAKRRSRPQEAGELGIESRPVIDVHRDVKRDPGIEGAVGKRHCQHAPLLEAAEIGKPHARRQHLRQLDIFLGQINTRHAATLLARQTPGRAAQTATGIENAHAGLERHHFDRLQGREPPRSVKLIDRSEIFDSRRVRIGPGLRKAAQNRFDETGLAVMCCNGVFEIAGFG